MSLVMMAPDLGTGRCGVCVVRRFRSSCPRRQNVVHYSELKLTVEALCLAFAPAA